MRAPSEAASSLYCWGRGDVYGTDSSDASPYTTLSRPDNQILIHKITIYFLALAVRAPNSVVAKYGEPQHIYYGSHAP